MLVFKPLTGCLDFIDSGLMNAVLSFNFSNFSVSSAKIAWLSEDKVFSGDFTGRVSFRLETEAGKFLRIAVENTSDNHIFLENIKIVFPELLESSEYIEYLDVPGNICGTRKVGVANRWFHGEVTSSMLYCLSSTVKDEALLIGALPPHHGDYVTIRALHAEQHLEGKFGVEICSEQARMLLPGREAKVSELYFELGDCGNHLLASYSDIWAKRRPQPLKPRCQGWNSWDFYGGSVTAEVCQKNWETGRRYFGNAFKYIVVDDGWETRWGQWTPNCNFPDGTKEFCRQIAAQGGIPGIWTAPTLVSIHTCIYRNHPEWFGRDRSGNIALKSYGPGLMAYLDPTHPEAAQFLTELFTGLRHEGIKYFKVDFTRGLLACETFHDMTLGRGGIIRRCFEIIRKAVGKDAYVLGCGVPYESVFGLVDGVRTTVDIRNFWSHVLANGATMAARAWMGGKLFNADPDFLIVRGKDTSATIKCNPEYVPRPFDGQHCWMAGREFNLAEAKVYALCVYLNGGDILLGDNLEELNPIGLELLRRVFNAPRITRSAIPVDLFKSHCRQPSLLAAHEEWGTAVGVFNWEEDTTQILVDPVAMGIDFAGAYDFWSRKDKGMCKRYKIELQPRSAECILFAKCKDLQI